MIDEGESKQVSVAQGLNYFNNDDYIDKVNIDSEEEFWSSFPRNRSSWNFIMGGGPQRPDTCDMTAAQEAAALKNTKRQGSCSRTNDA
jgi:hypothetical protein